MSKDESIAAIAPKLEFSLVVLHGKDKGTVYRLTGNKITIGRSEDNAIQFPNDLKCSRHHAVITFTENGIEIENITDNNHIEVDGNKVHRHIIKNGSIISIGETELQLKVIILSESTTNLIRRDGNLQKHQNIFTKFNYTSSNQDTKNTSTPDKQKKFKSKFKVLVVIIILLFLYLFTATTNKKSDVTSIRTDKEIETEIEILNKLKEAKIAQRNKRGKNSRQFDNAQSAYVSGFRDYKQGNFGRALEAFQACLSLFPNHALCNRYLRLAKRKFNELVQYHMILGRKYREQSQYSACRASFRNVMVMVVDVNSVIYKEAKVNFEACDTMLEDRF